MNKHTSTTEEILHLVGLAYACACDPNKTTEFLRGLVDHLGAKTAQIFTVDLSAGRVLQSQSSDPDAEAAVQDYPIQSGAADPRIQLLRSMPAGEVLQWHQHCNDAFVRGFHQDYLIPNGLRWCIAAMFPSGPERVTGMLVARGPEALPFESCKVNTLRLLLPHLQQAQAISSRLAEHAVAQQCATDERMAQVHPQPDVMACRARLTRAEMEVLASLLKGLPAKAIASRRSASVHTVRSQIMAILDKTGYSSQRELIASFSSSNLPQSAFATSTFQ